MVFTVVSWCQIFVTMSSFSGLLVLVLFWIGVYAKELTEAGDEVDMPLRAEDLFLPSHITRVLVPGYQEFAMMYRDVTCRFRVTMRERGEQNKQYQYRAGAFCGDRFIEGDKYTIRDCAVFACSNDPIDTCGKRFTNNTENSTAIFDELYIEAFLPVTKQKNNNATLFPSAYNESFFKIEPENYNFSVKDNNTVYRMSLRNSEAELFVFCLLGRQKINESSNTSTESPKEEVGENRDIITLETLLEDEKEEIQEDNDAGRVKNIQVPLISH